MKLRQKLAVVLASAMVVTAVPVVTMAASDNGMLREVLAVKKDTTFTEPTTAGGLQIKFKDAWQGKQEVFYLELENAEWNQNAMKAVLTTAAGMNVATSTVGTSYEVNEYEFVSKKVLKVKLTPNTTDVYTLPLLVTAKGGDAKVTLKKEGSTSTVTDTTWVFATTAEKQLNFTADEANSFYTEGKLATVTFKENFKGSLGNNTAQIKYEIQDADYTFDFPGTPSREITIDGDTYDVYVLDADKYLEYSYGFAGCTNNATVYVNQDDQGIAIFNLRGLSNPDSLGQIKLKNIPVATTEKQPDEGELLVDITNVGSVDALSNPKEDVVLGKIVKYSTYIEMKDQKPVEIKAGQAEEIEFKIGEYVDDSMVGDRQVEITLDNEDAHFMTGSVSLEDQRNGNDKHEVVNGIGAITYEYVNDKDHSEGIKKIIVKLDKKLQVNEKIDWFTLKAKVCVPVDQKDVKEIKIKAEGRALESAVETTAVTVVNPFDVSMEELRVKVGLQGQVGGKVVITETDKAMLNKGTLEFKVINPETEEVVEGITFYNKDNVSFSVEGDMKKADLEHVSTTGSVKIKVNRQSKAASTLTLEDFKVTVDRTVPEGKYDLVISGDAIDAHGHTLTVKDFFVVGTPNTEDIAANGLRRGTVTFAMDEDKYVANGIEYKMDAKSYIQDPGYTMVPVRYVAEAFGVAQKDILFSNSTATIFAGERTIQLKVGSDIAIVNGAQIKMATKVAIKNDRIYAPIGEIATILGVKKDWKPETKTATFINE